MKGWATRPLGAIEGTWKLPFGNIALVYADGVITGRAEITKERSRFANPLFQPEEKTTETEIYTATGTVTGAAWKFEVSIANKDFSPLAGLAGPRTIQGYVVFNEVADSGIYAEVIDGKPRETKLIRKV